MARILAVGIATLDIVNVVASYPSEDEEVRALTQRVGRGGNATNSLVVLSQLGHQCSWAGTLAAEPDSDRIRADLARYDINVTACRQYPNGKVPTSYINSSKATGSRTIVHYRDLPEYDFESFQRIDLDTLDWLHFEGRNVAETAKMLRHARQQNPKLRISVEIEKPREGIEQLFTEPSVLLFSQNYMQHCGANNPSLFLESMRVRAPQADLIVAVGERGAYGLTVDGLACYRPAVADLAIVDSLGAGDTFNAAVIDAYLRGISFVDTLAFGNRIAGYKCTVHGFDMVAILKQ